jgi:large subunit ribosomal protein L9
MRVFLLKDVERIGMAGEIIKTSEGYARNYLIPRKLAVEVTAHNEAQFVNRVKTIEHRKEVVATKTSMLAEKIKSLELVLKRKMHDGNQLYGSVSSHEIMELLAEKGVSVAKNQLLYDTIKTKGTYPITVKLSSKLQPKLTLKVVPE